MKRFLLSLFFVFGANGLFAHIDRAIDALKFEGISYEAYSQPLDSYIEDNRVLRRKLLTNPINKRLPKHYYATYEIRDNKLYLDNIELIVISEKLMRSWRAPLALNYSLEPVKASDLFGKDANYPIFCDWFSGDIYATIYDGERDTRRLFNQNFLFKIKDGEFVGQTSLDTRTIFGKFVSMEESKLIYKLFTDDSFSVNNMLFDLRCIDNLRFLRKNEFFQINAGQSFRTRGYLHFDSKRRPFLTVSKTRATKAVSINLYGIPSAALSEYKEGDRVEATLCFPAGTFSRAGLIDLRILNDDELIHSPDFFLR